jgi:hypothetical protein
MAMTIGGDNMEDPRQRDAAFFARLFQACGVTVYVVVAKCRRQGGSVSFSFTPGLYALCGMIVWIKPFQLSEKAGKKQRLREILSLSQISRLLRKIRETKIGAHPLLWRINFR